MARAVRALGWTLITSGVVVLLYVVYLLWFTGLETNQAQRDFARDFPVPPAADDPEPTGGDAAPQRPDIRPRPLERDETIELGEAFAALWFERDGERIVNNDILYVVSGSSLDLLRLGPGHYTQTDVPGGPTNFAVAGHRTTYGSPFWSLDELTEGDTIHVLDRAGQEWVYGYLETRIVRPTDVWVIEEDPLNTGGPVITLTTCHPRHSAAERLIVWGELLTEADHDGIDGEDGLDGDDGAAPADAAPTSADPTDAAA